MLKAVTEKIQNEVKEQKGWFLSMLLGTLGATVLGNFLAGREINRAVTNRASEGLQEPVMVVVPLKGIFNAASSFNQFWNTKALSK